MILDDMEINPEKYKGKNLSELTDDVDFDEENSVEYAEAYYKKTLLPKMILVSTALMMLHSSASCLTHLLIVMLWQKTSVRELDLETALAEREVSFPNIFCNAYYTAG